MFRLVAHVVVLASLCGCALIDQNTFGPSPEAAPPAKPPPVADSRPALVTIRYDVPDPAYQDLLRYAVRQAEARRPGGGFDIVSVVPAKGAIADQVAAAQAATRNAGTVAQSMTGLGVAPARLHLGARADPAVSAPEVRVYVR